MRDWVRISVFGILIVLMQGFFFNQLGTVGVGPPFVFLLFLIMLPTGLSSSAMMLVAFISGLAVDFLGSSYATGLHAAACVPMILFRDRFLDIVVGTNVRSGSSINLQELRGAEFVSVALPLILIHHLIYYGLEAFTLRHLFITLLELVTGGTFTLLLCLLGYSIFFKRK